ncbi:MAG: RHS repeat-associated core domain-containing protein [Phycisphaerales bacterium]
MDNARQRRPTCAGSFDFVNELTSFDQHYQTTGSATVWNFTYNLAGDMVSRDLGGGNKYLFSHDAWGRLTQVTYVASGGACADGGCTRSTYRYDGLNHRCTIDRDTDASGSYDEHRSLYYSADWQVLEERVDNTSPFNGATTDRVVQNVWGLRHVDDLVMRRQNNNAASDSDYIDAGDRRSDYVLQDLQFSTVAVLDSSATLVERVDYDAYGEARHHLARDVDGDGDVSSADYDPARGAQGKSIGTSGYYPDADWDRDGDVDSTDVSNFASTYYESAVAPGLIAKPGYDFDVGFCGYRFNSETANYTVRFRHYDPGAGLGRWLERDPAGYVDSWSLYGYGTNSPLGGMDPSGRGFWGNAWSLVKGAAVGVAVAVAATVAVAVVVATAPVWVATLVTGTLIVAGTALSVPIAYRLSGKFFNGPGWNEDDYFDFGSLLGGWLTGFALPRLIGIWSPGGRGNLGEAPGRRVPNVGSEPAPGSGAARPSGVPNHWKMKPSRDGTGIEWFDPANAGNRVRQMPGNPNSINPGQRVPYFKIQKQGNKWFDKNLNPVKNQCEESHIPIEDWPGLPPDFWDAALEVPGGENGSEWMAGSPTGLGEGARRSRVPTPSLVYAGTAGVFL